jgi:hypothetical protein
MGGGHQEREDDGFGHLRKAVSVSESCLQDLAIRVRRLEEPAGSSTPASRGRQSPSSFRAACQSSSRPISCGARNLGPSGGGSSSSPSHLVLRMKRNQVVEIHGPPSGPPSSTSRRKAATSHSRPVGECPSDVDSKSEGPAPRREEPQEDRDAFMKPTWIDEGGGNASRAADRERSIRCEREEPSVIARRRREMMEEEEEEEAGLTENGEAELSANSRKAKRLLGRHFLSWQKVANAQIFLNRVDKGKEKAAQLHVLIRFGWWARLQVSDVRQRRLHLSQHSARFCCNSIQAECLRLTQVLCRKAASQSSGRCLSRCIQGWAVLARNSANARRLSSRIKYAVQMEMKNNAIAVMKNLLFEGKCRRALESKVSFFNLWRRHWKRHVCSPSRVRPCRSCRSGDGP